MIIRLLILIAVATVTVIFPYIVGLTLIKDYKNTPKLLLWVIGFATILTTSVISFGICKLIFLAYNWLLTGNV